MSACLVCDFAERLGIDASVDGLTDGRVDRHRKHECVGAKERRAQLAQRCVARRIGAIGDQHQRRAIAGTLIDHRQCGQHAVVDGRPAGRTQRIERTAHGRALAWCDPRRQQMRRVIKRHYERRVVRCKELEEKPFHGYTGIKDALAEHAVADVKQDTESDRNTVVGELCDRLRLAVLVNGERLGRQIGNETAVSVANGCRDHRELDARPQHPR
jgi:hypothetical protein